MNYQQLNSKIDRVKLYAAGATVSRVAELADRNEVVEIPGLPLALDDSSVRVRVESDSGNSAFAAIATDVRIGLGVPPQTETQAFPLEAEISTARTEVQQLEELLTVIDHEIKVISRIEIPQRFSGEGEKAPPPSPTMMRMAIANYKNQQIRDRMQEQREIREKLRQAQENLNDLLEKQSRASSAKEARPHELRKIAIIRLTYPEIDSNQPLSCQRLILEYFVPGTRWTPTYICRLDTVANTATIAMRALICQKTGEDWNGVSLELSTAQPMMWCDLPELPSLRLGRAQPTPQKSGWRLPPVGAELLFEDYDRGFSQPTLSDQVIPQIKTMIPPPSPMAVSPLENGDFSADEFDLAEESEFAEFQQEPLERKPDDRPAKISHKKASTNDNPFEMNLLGDRPDYNPPDVNMCPRPAPSPLSMWKMRRQAKIEDVEADVLEESYISSPASLVKESLMFEEKKINRLILAYNLMEMPAPDRRDQRGKLSLIQQQETYLEILQTQELIVNFDVIDPVKLAIYQAKQCLNQPLPSGGINVRQVAGSFDYAYPGTGRVDVASDGQFHSVALTGEGTEMEIYYVTVPREAADVFRMAKLRNPLPSPLLTGLTDVYLDGEYLLSTTIKTVPPKGEMDLGLGVEESIKVARNTTYKENRGGNLLVGVNELHHEIKIDLVNNLSKDAKIEVRDRVPIPAKDAKVDVSIDAVSPPWEKYPQTERDLPIEGGYHWWVNLSPGEEKTLAVQYTLKIAVDRELIGGNRREE
ncbi:DUF4139 domain-containing protein [Planktothricoides sp. FACHB-1370]|uniref:DUF4139 domain-containing protein n=1 Tax=Planktothricoides raciborskii FACHB-1370 TaxID=2949576 RepID=A0ABR8E7F9_9CYAN|nr:DUF4139 domain-containing protein [Planktothricoides raciborskii FACHB-1370]MBD2581985.1 DUF4139 domain-containing protein [Planktothricoides raciborskii FACHB-1261]